MLYREQKDIVTSPILDPLRHTLTNLHWRKASLIMMKAPWEFLSCVTSFVLLRKIADSQETLVKKKEEKKNASQAVPDLVAWRAPQKRLQEPF